MIWGGGGRRSPSRPRWRGHPFAPWLRARLAESYTVHLVFLWLASSALALVRVAERVPRGGHGLPDQVVRRRYAAGLRNFFSRYRPLATTPVRQRRGPHHTAHCQWPSGCDTIADPDVWANLVRHWSAGG